MRSLVLVPGLLCNRLLWADQITALGRYADICVGDLTTQETIPQMAAAVLDSAPERFSLAGFSLGGAVALEIMEVASQRVERLALLSTTHGGLLPPTERSIRQAIETIAQGGFDSYLEAVYPAYFAAQRDTDPILKRSFMEMAHAVGPAAGLRQMRALLAVQGPFPKLGELRCPTIIIGGREDKRTTPEAHETLAREIPGSELILIDDAAHFTPLERPKQVTAALERWLIA